MAADMPCLDLRTQEATGLSKNMKAQPCSSCPELVPFGADRATALQTPKGTTDITVHVKDPSWSWVV